MYDGHVWSGGKRCNVREKKEASQMITLVSGNDPCRLPLVISGGENSILIREHLGLEGSV